MAAVMGESSRRGCGDLGVHGDGCHHHGEPWLKGHIRAAQPGEPTRAFHRHPILLFGDCIGGLNSLLVPPLVMAGISAIESINLALFTRTEIA